MEKFLELIDRGAGSLLILLPTDMETVDTGLLEVCGCVGVCVCGGGGGIVHLHESWYDQV